MSDTSGSVKSVTLAGIPFNVKADANLNTMLTKFENSRTKHSGGSMRKMVARILTVEGVVLILNGTDRENLRQIAESTDDVTLAYEDAGGNNYHAFGSIEVEGWESEDNNVNCILQPEGDWTPFLA